MAPSKRQIEQAYAANSRPTLSTTAKASSLVLPIAGKPRGTALMTNGVLTQSGKHYERISGTSLLHDNGFRGRPYTSATQERVMTHKGTWTRLGTMKDGVYTPTPMGLRYYKEHPTSYIVQVPIHVLGRNAKGGQYERDTHTPVEVDVDLH